MHLECGSRIRFMFLPVYSVVNTELCAFVVVYKMTRTAAGYLAFSKCLSKELRCNCYIIILHLSVYLQQVPDLLGIKGTSHVRYGRRLALVERSSQFQRDCKVLLHQDLRHQNRSKSKKSCEQDCNETRSH